MRVDALRRGRRDGDGEEQRGVLVGVDAVPPGRQNEKISAHRVPGVRSADQPHPPPQHGDRRLLGRTVLRKRRTGPEGNERLPQHLLVPAEDGLRAAPVGGPGSPSQMLPYQRVQGEFPHSPSLAPSAPGPP